LDVLQIAIRLPRIEGSLRDAEVSRVEYFPKLVFGFLMCYDESSVGVEGLPHDPDVDGLLQIFS